MKSIRNTIYFTFLLFSLLWTLTSCSNRTSTGYITIQFPLGQGGATMPISANCSSWGDGCNTYCRCPGQPTAYIQIEDIKNCVDQLRKTPFCVDDERTKVQKCNETVPIKCVRDPQKMAASR